MRTLKNTENTPEVRAKIATCGLDKVALVAKLATPENQHIYAEHIENMSTPALQAFTKEIRQGKPEAPKMMIELDEEMQIIFNQLKKTQGPNLSNQQALRGILKSVSEDVFSKTSQSNTTEKPPASSGESDAHPLPTIPSGSITSLSLPTDLAQAPKVPTRAIPARIKRAIYQKTNGKCAYPHCTKPIENYHHTTPFSFNLSHENIVGLCKIHHELCHNGVIKNELKDPENWQLDLEPHKSIYDNLYLKYKAQVQTKAA